MPEKEQNRRIRRQTVFYKDDDGIGKVQQRKKKKISVDVGIIPQNLKSIIKKQSTSTANRRLSIKILKKYHNRQKATFNEKYSIRFVSPLPGWRDDYVRMPDSDNESENEFGKTILQKVQLTPESVKKISECNLEDEDSIVKFNATLKLPAPKEVPNKKRSRRKSVKDEVLVAENVLNNQATISNISLGQGDTIQENEKEDHKMPEQANRKQRRKSVRENIQEDIGINLNTNNASKKRRSMAFNMESVQDTKELSSSKKQEVSSQDKTLNQKTQHGKVLKHSEARQEKLSLWLNNLASSTNVPNTDDHIPKESTSEVESSQTTRTKRKQSGNKKQKNKQIKVKSSKPIESKNGPPSPDIIELEMKEIQLSPSKREKITIRNSKKRNELKEAKTYKAQEYNIKSILSDFAPIKLEHLIEPIQTDSKSDYQLKMIKEKKEKIFIPEYRLPKLLHPTLEGFKIKLVTADEYKEMSERFDEQEREWSNTFKEYDFLNGNWADLSCPKLSAAWLGDPLIVGRAREYIIKWKRRVAKEDNLEKPSAKGAKSYDHDEDYEENSDNALTNPLILCGPPGSGKTALIAALSSEFNMNILEVQPGDKRNSVAIKQKFDGALKSHMINKARMSIASFFGNKPKACPNNELGKQNLLIVEHADLVFEEDKDFWPTLKNMAADAHVPIIWTCENFPVAEISKEPPLTSYELINISHCSSSLLAKFTKSILLNARQLKAPLADLEKYVTALGCDLRKILFDLQFQTAQLNCDFIRLPLAAKINVLPLNSDKETTYKDSQELIEDKKDQYSSILEELEISRKCEKPADFLLQAAQTLKERLPQKFLALDYLPYLAEIDKVEQRKKVQRRKRRALHYFHEVRSEEGCIDSTGNLLPLVRDFSLLVNDIL